MTGWWRRTREVATGAAAAVVVFAAVPSVLVALVGLPWPRGNAGIVSWHGLFDLLAVVAWCAWAACAWPLLCSVISRVRARDATSPGGARLVDQFALRIAAGVLAVSPVIATSTSPSAGAAIRRAPVAAMAAAAMPVAATPSRRLAAIVAGSPTSLPVPIEAGRTYTVSAGESLWTIAESCYDDGAAWPAIAEANLGQVMDDGMRFVDPSLIRPGWVLTIPDLTARPVTAPALPTDDSAPPPDPSFGAAATGLTASRRTRRSRRPRTPERSGRTASAAGTSKGPASPVPAPELAVLGCGALVAALLARRARRGRKLATFLRREGLASEPPSTAGADLAVAVDGFDRVPVVEWVELAARHLDWATTSCSDDGPAPRVVLMRAGPDGVEVRLSPNRGKPPPGWVAHGASSWLLPSSSDLAVLSRAASGHEPWSPLLLPVGDDDTGTWLLPLEAGSVVHVLGPAAGRLVQAMRACAESWTWHELLVVSEDRAVVAREAQSNLPRVDGTPRAHVLFVGDPSELPGSVLERCAVLSLGKPGTAGVTVVVDEEAATVHPLGITVRPHLLRASWVQAVVELDGETAATAPRRRAAVVPLRQHERVGSATVSVRGEAAPDLAGDVPVATDAIEVRLLTAVPRIDGLRGPIDPKRARRAIEVVAYLAVHHPEPVTGDRLRTRVLGSADVDAAAKTLFNTAGAARRALGANAEGLPLLPPASRSGHYRLSPLVTLDVQRLTGLVAAGLAASEPAEASALLEQALTIVEGEPLSSVLTGYGWWRAEGHERRTADLVVDGACRLVRESIAGGRLDLARWALERARLVEPCSEPLARAAMEAAAATGDLRRLHLEWQSCQRQADELDPGSTPSQATERLYARLRDQLTTRAEHEVKAAAPMRAGTGGVPRY